MAIAWGAEVDSTQLTTVSTEQFFSQEPTPLPNEIVRVSITGNSSGTTDNLTISVYSSLDGVVWTTVPDYSFDLDVTDGADNIVEFVVHDTYQFRVGVQRTGSTDTFTVDMSHRIGTQS